MKLNVFSWNARSIQGKLIELRNHLNSNFYHIILLQETWLNPKVSFNIPHYTCIRKDRESESRYPHGGVLILVHRSVTFKETKFAKLKFSEAIFIRVFSGTRELIIGTVYVSPSLSCAERKFDYEKLVSRPGPFVIAGDFNAKSTAWNNLKGDRSGANLLRLCDERLCEIKFTNKPTTIPPIGPPSFLDLVVSKNVTGIKRPETLNQLSSDHFPITFQIPINIPVEESMKLPNYAKANWKKFREQLSSETKSITKSPKFSLHSQINIDENILALEGIIKKATKDSVPLKKPYQFRYVFSQKVKEVINDRNFIRRQIVYYQKNSVQYTALKAEFNRLNREVKREIVLLNQHNWNEKLATLKTDDCSLYAMAKSLKRKRSGIPPLQNPATGEMVYADKGKTEILARSFLKAH